LLDESRRAVITGMGALSPLGTLDAYWEGLKAGRSGIRRVTHFDPSNLDVKIGGEVDFDPTEHINYKDARRMSRASQMALVAARMALADAGLTPGEVASEPERAAVILGTAAAGAEILIDTTIEYQNKGRRPRPFALINGLPNMPGHYVSAEVDARGPLATISTACASGTQAIGAAADLIRTGRAEVVFTGGVDCLIREEVFAAFTAMTILPTGYNDDPAAASRPFDAERSGFVLSEGAGSLVVESLARARARGARIYAEVLGHAASSDAHHSAAPDEEGRGAQNAMRWALADAGIAPSSVDYVNAHGTGTEVNDALETYAIKQVLGERAYEIPITSTKSMIGHCMGGSGALEAIACVMTLHEGIVHPTINLHTPDPACDLDYVPNEARQVAARTALSNSFGLGGQNACLVLGAAPG
jgi:beta-ketoacyl-acyl-carrier-protein synthase II